MSGRLLYCVGTKVSPSEQTFDDNVTIAGVCLPGLAISLFWNVIFVCAQILLNDWPSRSRCDTSVRHRLLLTRKHLFILGYYSMCVRFSESG